MSLEITPEHVKELATLFGENVLVPMPCEHPPAGSLWVIGTGNKHYEGARTVYATSEQVQELATDEDYDEDGDLSDAAAERIARELNARNKNDARASAYTMSYADGFSARVMDAMLRND
jgi:hypothetical protein